MSYDDIELAKYLAPFLGTIHQPKDLLSELAIDTLINRLQNRERGTQVLVLSSKLVERASASQLQLASFLGSWPLIRLWPFFLPNNINISDEDTVTTP